MTKREEQIFRWICENPMISQEEIAYKAGITRSSVGVHISNLMRKGYIAGKGYITSRPDYYVVLGTSNIDIGAKALSSEKAADSVPGTIFTSAGGVGRNIAHNMKLLGLPVRLISVFGDDDYAEMLVKSLSRLDIDTSSSLFLRHQNSSFYMFVEDEKGRNQLALSDTSIVSKLTVDFIKEKMSIINEAKALIVDTNIPDDVLTYLAGNCKIPIICDPTSIVKAENLKPFLRRFHTVCPSVMEAEVMTGMKATDDESISLIAKKLINSGLKRVFITMNNRGACCADENNCFFIESYAKTRKNTTGAGDALTAAVVLGYDMDLSLEDTAKLAMAAAAKTCEGDSTVNDKMTREACLTLASL